MGYVTGLGRAMVGVTRLGGVVIQAGFAKRTAVRQFEQSLLEQGLPRRAASHLADEYADMVSLNPLAYARAFRARRHSSM